MAGLIAGSRCGPAALVPVIAPGAPVIVPISPVVARRAAVPARVRAIRVGVIFLVEARRHAAAGPAFLLAVAPARRIGTAIRAAIAIAMFCKGRRRHAGADDNSRDQRRRGNTPGHNATSTIIVLSRKTPWTSVVFRLARRARRADQAGAAVDDERLAGDV